MRNADILILPSRDEGLPMAILEAMAAGVAVISTPVGAISDAVIDNQTGLLVHPATYKALRTRSCGFSRMLRFDSGSRQTAELARSDVHDRPHGQCSRRHISGTRCRIMPGLRPNEPGALEDREMPSGSGRIRETNAHFRPRWSRVGGGINDLCSVEHLPYERTEILVGGLRQRNLREKPAHSLPMICGQKQCTTHGAKKRHVGSLPHCPAVPGGVKVTTLEIRRAPRPQPALNPCPVEALYFAGTVGIHPPVWSEECIRQLTFHTMRRPL